MQMTRTLAKGDGIHALATAELLHQLRTVLHNPPPLRGFLSGELKRATQMTHGIQQQQTGQGRGIGVMTQQPASVATDFIPTPLLGVAVVVANAARLHAT
jgi:hypothetical protein